MSENHKPLSCKPMSQAEFARELNVSRQWVSSLKRDNRLVMLDEKVDPIPSLIKLMETANAKYDQTDYARFLPIDVLFDISKGRSITTTETETEEYDFKHEQAKREHFQAEISRVNAELLMEKLVYKEAVQQANFTICMRIRENMLAIPARIIPTMAAMTDENAMEEFLYDEIVKALKETAKLIEQDEEEACSQQE